MSTAEATEQRASAPSVVTFRSRGNNFKVVLTPADRIPGKFGIENVKGRYADFHPHGEFQTDDLDVIEHLRGLQSYGVEFYEVGAEPDRIPSGEAVIAAISEATIELDDERLESIELEEQAGFKRPDVLTAARQARAAIQRVQASRDAAVSDQLEQAGDVSPPGDFLG